MKTQRTCAIESQTRKQKLSSLRWQNACRDCQYSKKKATIEALAWKKSARPIYVQTSNSQFKSGPLAEVPVQSTRIPEARQNTGVPPDTCTVNSSNFSEKQCAQTLTAPSAVKARHMVADYPTGHDSNRIIDALLTLIRRSPHRMGPSGSTGWRAPDCACQRLSAWPSCLH